MQGDFVADRAIYVDADDKVVDANDPKKLTKIADVGGRVSEADVQKYGLRTEPEKKDDVPKLSAEPAKKTGKVKADSEPKP